MKFKLAKKPVPTVTVAGEIDIKNAGRIGAAIHEAVKAGQDIILDFTDVTYLDSSGVNLIFTASRLNHVVSRRVFLLVKDKNVRRLLEIVGAAQLPNLTLDGHKGTPSSFSS